MHRPCIARPLTLLLAASATALAAQQPDSVRDTTVVLEPVVVRAAAPRAKAARTFTATKSDRLLRDVPQAVTVISRQLLLDQSMQSMADVVRYIPGVSMGQGEGHRDAPTIRGQSSTADFFVDGVRDDAQYIRDLYNLERVEALKGPNAMMFGRGGGGGVINRVTKAAQWSPSRTLTVAGGSFDHKRTTLDVGSPLGAAVAGRLNAMLERSEQFRDRTDLERVGINPTLAIRTRNSGGAQVQLGFEHFSDRRTVNRGIPSFQGRPSQADIATFFGDPDASPSRVDVDAATATIERGAERGISVRNSTRVARYDKFYQNVYPGGAVNAAGTQVSLSAYNSGMYRLNVFNQTDLSYAVGRPDGLRQRFLLGAEMGRQRSLNFRNTGFFNDTATAYPVPFASPTVQPPVTYRQTASDADNEVTAIVASLYAQDEITLGASWQAVVGARYDRFALDFHNRRNGQGLERVDHELSPRAGLVFKPVEPLSLYATYSVSFLPGSGDQFSSLTATTETLEPEQFRNRELGLKWDLRPDLALTGALYQLDRSNTTAPDPNDAARVVQTGKQRTTGFELGLAGAVTGDWDVAAGYALQRARIVSRTSAADVGATVPLVPYATLSLWNRYQVTPWLAGGIGLVHQSDMYAAIDNAVTLPGFTRVDVAAYVTLNHLVRAQINIENVLNERYYATSHGNNNIMPGAPRTLRVTMSATP
jgi:catecholate siderophore receptor